MNKPSKNNAQSETFQYINGVPKECLTDNMSSIINLSEKKMNWLYPYNNEFDTEEELIEIIKKINK